MPKSSATLVFQLLSAENALSDISLRRLRISRYAELNDPFELFGATFADPAHRRGLRDWRKAFNADYGLLCFSRDWKNPVLWSHYASKHRGICLAFAIPKSFVARVRYSPRRLPIRFVDDDPAKGLDESFVNELLTTKYAHWRYEKEVRAFLRLDHSTIEGGSYFYPFDDTLKLRAVILGPLCEVPIDRVRAMVNSLYSEVSVIKARLAFKWFDVVGDERTVREDREIHKAKGTRPLWRLGTPTKPKPR